MPKRRRSAATKGTPEGEGDGLFPPADRSARAGPVAPSREDVAAAAAELRKARSAPKPLLKHRMAEESVEFERARVASELLCRQRIQSDFVACRALADALVHFVATQDLSLLDVWKCEMETPPGSFSGFLCAMPDIPSMPRFAQGGAYMAWYLHLRSYLESRKTTGMWTYCTGAPELPTLQEICNTARSNLRVAEAAVHFSAAINEQ